MTNDLRKFFDKASRVSATLGDAAAATLYPSACRVCGDMIESWRDGVACSACWREVEQNAADLREVLGAAAARVARRGQRQALRALRPLRLRRRSLLRALPRGDARGRSAAERAPHIPPRLRGALRQAFDALPDSNLIESIIPTPLHPKRLAERGFNQSGGHRARSWRADRVEGGPDGLDPRQKDRTPPRRDGRA